MITPTAQFKDNLALLPAIDHLAGLDLRDADGAHLGAIENAPGKQGSLRVYAYLAATFGAITPEAARHGLDLFAEHTDDARARPGAHPNIDRLFAVIASGRALQVTPRPAA